MLTSCEMPAHNNNFKSKRVERAATIVLNAPLEKVFPLFGPIREKDWAHGWDPTIIFPADTLVSKHMVFRTSGGLHGSNEPYTWTIVGYETQRSFIEYQVTASDRLWFISISCAANGDSTAASIKYSYTGLTEEGNKKNEVAIEKMYESDLKDWETAINKYLSTVL